MPLPLALMLLVFALVLFQVQRHKAAKTVLFTAVLSLYLLSTAPVSHMLAAPLEYKYPAYQNQSVEYVVVLGGWHKEDERQPITSLLGSASWVRLSEGLRILSLNPEAKLLLSGYGAGKAFSNAEAMERVAINFGVDPERIMLRTKTKDTAEEAKAWARVVGSHPVALVTSASHIPRAMRLFKQYGITPIAAPTNYHTSNEPLDWKAFVPRSSNLDLSTKAWHEYLGIIWAWLRA